MSVLLETTAAWLAYAESEVLMLGATTAAVLLGLGQRLVVGFCGKSAEARKRSVARTVGGATRYFGP